VTALFRDDLDGAGVEGESTSQDGHDLEDWFQAEAELAGQKARRASAQAQEHPAASHRRHTRHETQDPPVRPFIVAVPWGSTLPTEVPPSGASTAELVSRS
jgi:Protein of unknown function (DUF2934)